MAQDPRLTVVLLVRVLKNGQDLGGGYFQPQPTLDSNGEWTVSVAVHRDPKDAAEPKSGQAVKLIAFIVDKNAATRHEHEKGTGVNTYSEENVRDMDLYVQSAPVTVKIEEWTRMEPALSSESTK